MFIFDFRELFAENGAFRCIENDNTTFNYVWYRKDTEEEDAELVELASGVANKYNATEPGWYTVAMTASLNRQTNEGNAEKFCLVRDEKAKAPVLKDDDGEVFGEQVIINQIDEESDVILSVNAEIVKPENKALSLYSTGLIYKWYIQESEELERLLDPSEIVGGGVSTSTITVKQDPTGKQLSYRCIVTNYLDKSDASSSVLFRVN